jgi:tetrahydrodipicolinate N-succinyltransferase
MKDWNEPTPKEARRAEELKEEEARLLDGEQTRKKAYLAREDKIEEASRDRDIKHAHELVDE